ncbi:membrane protein containing DUF6, transmembrane [Candidatus Thiomargarita nelsonii]|uniref:Membrane protein containing DUF6, transmembrane n=1 Tax=Candidatus Thiomargarita nelsonii TaxID=1003181 RepID=A0A176S6J5_9GAMM|nr:membrane protein containing DUF6, transmembrane [Candidatus Thiomargarita nelsonii]
MFETTLLTTFFALGATIAWGSGDFSGGLAVKRHNVYSVLLAAQLISFIPLLLLVLSFEFIVPQTADLLLGGLGGVCSMIGLLNLYTGLARGRMSIVAPLAAITASVIPVLIGILSDGPPTTVQSIGFIIALVAVWFLSSDGQRLEATAIELRFAIISGVGFAAFYVAIDRVSGDTALWPVLAARVASLIALSLYTISRRKWHTPTRSLLPLIALVGLLDTAGNYFFTMATQVGRLDVATIVSSLYPAITIMLAWLILKERYFEATFNNQEQ